MQGPPRVPTGSPVAHEHSQPACHPATLERQPPTAGTGWAEARRIDPLAGVVLRRSLLEDALEPGAPRPQAPPADNERRSNRVAAGDEPRDLLRQTDSSVSIAADVQSKSTVDDVVLRRYPADKGAGPNDVTVDGGCQACDRSKRGKQHRSNGTPGKASPQPFIRRAEARRRALASSRGKIHCGRW
jgi:hypothetical protein